MTPHFYHHNSPHVISNLGDFFSLTPSKEGATEFSGNENCFVLYYVHTKHAVMTFFF